MTPNSKIMRMTACDSLVGEDLIYLELDGSLMPAENELAREPYSDTYLRGAARYSLGGFFGGYLAISLSKLSMEPLLRMRNACNEEDLIAF